MIPSSLVNFCSFVFAVDISDEGIDSDGEHEMAQQMSPAGVVSNPEYFDDDAFDIGMSTVPGMPTGNGVVPTSPSRHNGIPHRFGSERHSSGGSKEYYNSLDNDSAVDGMTVSRPDTGRDRLSSRV